MADQQHPEGYRTARIAIALALAVAAVLIVIADSLSLGRPVEPIVLGSLLLTAAGLLAVELPDLRK